MEIFANIPLIPILAFVVIAAFFAFQMRIYLKERKKGKTPTVPTLGTTPLKDTSPAFVQKMDTVAAAVSTKPLTSAKKLRPISSFLTVAILVLLVVSIAGFFFLFQREDRLSFVPRAAVEPTSPLLPTLLPTVPITSPATTQPATPTTAALPTAATLPTPTTTAAATKAPVVSPTSVALLPPAAEPITTAAAPTPTSTLLAYYSTNVFPTEEPTPSPEPSEEKKPTPTPKPKKEIPQAGITVASVGLLLGSVVLLTLGFVL